jgi:hypothetical protein
MTTAFSSLCADQNDVHVPIGTRHDFGAAVQDSARRIGLEWTETKDLAAGSHSNGPIIRLGSPDRRRIAKKSTHAGRVVLESRRENGNWRAMAVEWSRVDEKQCEGAIEW